MPSTGSAYLLADKRLFYSSQVLEGRQEHMCVLGASHILDKLAQLLAQCCQNLVFVLDRLI